MIATAQTLESLLLNNVLDLRFVRRIPVPGKPNTRRMLCTKSSTLLNSPNGRMVLNYRPPTHPKKVNEARSNVSVVWDILMQDYRVVSADQVNIIKSIPDNKEFWDYFNSTIYVMTAEQKIQYMNS